ncbi:hypothetical protein B0T14DRAFT_528305 [Immersiella caudata]|uniref:Uncharacterized protein n=1 Tax=Immersiella caudata TaxID=314043 RepID=A0AA39WFB3_9PEZI|nr:hypothetical protein B0T14DRAFT_528305 [Immersiella caudata]
MGKVYDARNETACITWSGRRRRLSKKEYAMVFLGAEHGLEVEEFVDAVDWTGVDLVVDVGGSQGTLAREFAKRLAHGGKVVGSSSR